MSVIEKEMYNYGHMHECLSINNHLVFNEIKIYNSIAQVRQTKQKIMMLRILFFAF